MSTNKKLTLPEEMSQELRDIYNAYLKAGFTEEKVWEVFMEVLHKPTTRSNH